MKAAAIYARVSTSDQVKGTSLDSQVEGCAGYAKQAGYTVVAEIGDDVSGALLNRPGLDKLRDMAERGDIQAAIVYDPDRLSRNLGHMMLLVDELERKRVELVFVNAPHENTPEGMMLLQMRGMFAQYERTKIQERSRRGKERRAKEGKVINSWMEPFGYSYIRGEGRFEIEPAEAEWVRRIFDWYVNENGSLRSIASKLNALAVPTKWGAACWHPSTVRSILTSTVYKGTWIWNRNESVPAKRRRFADGREPTREKSSSREKPAEEWIEVPVPPIIPAEMYEGVARQLDKNKRHERRNCKRDYLLRGLMVCMDCGRRITARSQGTSSQYYCTGRYDEGLRQTCLSPFMPVKRLDDEVWNRIATLLSNEKLIMKSLEGHEHIREDERRREDAELAALYSQEAALKSEEGRILGLFGKGIVDPELLQERIGAIRQQKDALQTVRLEVLEHRAQREHVQARTESVKRLVHLAQSGLQLFTFEEKREFLIALDIKGVVNSEADTLNITGLINLNILIDLGSERRASRRKDEASVPFQLSTLDQYPL